MQEYQHVPFPLFGLAVIFFCLLTIVGRKAKNAENHYDERQLVERGRAYKLAFFTLLIYNVIYGCVDGFGTKWCEPSVGMLVGVFLGVTVFACAAICSDAFGGIHNNTRSIILLWVLIIVVQLICFVLDCVDGVVIENGVLTIHFISLVNAVCFIIILAVYFVHHRKEKLLGEKE